MQNLDFSSVDKLRRSRAYHLAQNLVALIYLPLQLVSLLSNSLLLSRSVEKTSDNDTASTI